MDLFDLYAKISLDDSQYNKGVEDATTKGNNLAGTLKKGLATAGKVAAVGITAASTAIVGLGKIGFDYNKQMETYTTNFEVMLGDEELAIQKVEELKKFAASTPLSMADLADGTKTLLAFGVANEDSTDKLRQLGDIALGDADKMKRLATAYGKATAQGKVTGDTVQQMIDSGFNPLIEIANQSGESMEDLQKRMSAGKVTTEELDAAMQAVTSGTGQFAGGMEAASHTTEGLISTLKDNAQALVGEVFKPITDGILSDLLPTAIGYIDQLSTSFKEDGVNGMIGAVGDIIGGMIGKFVEKLPDFINIAVDILGSLLDGISDNLDIIIDGAIKTVKALLDGIIKLLPKIIEMGITILAKLAVGIIKAIPDLVLEIPKVITAIVNGFLAGMGEIANIGVQIVEGLWQGIESKAEWLGNKVTGFLDSIFGKAKENEEIHSPSKKWARFGGYMAEGVGVGFDDEFANVSKEIDNSLNFGVSSIGAKSKSKLQEAQYNITNNYYKQMSIKEENREQKKMLINLGRVITV